MGADLHDESAAARAVFARAEAVADLPLRRVCFEGPEEQLRSTDFAQPALVTTALAALAALAERIGVDADDRAALLDRLDVGWAAGHSLGEYAAAVAVGALTLEEGVRLAVERGRLMSDAPVGAMSAVLGLDAERIAAVLAEVRGAVVVANDNAPGQVVISGEADAVAQANAALKAAGAARVLPLNVGGAFHSPLMAAPAGRFAATIDAAAIADPLRPLVGNVDAAPLTTASAVRDELRRQIPSPVRWRETLLALAAAGATSAVECGPGGVLAGLARRTTPDVAVRPLGTWVDVVAVADAPAASRS
jgi:[acyl-carrier-protein] S-malonyltransferase